MSAVHPYRRPGPGEQPDYLSPAYASTVKRSPSQALILLPQSLSESLDVMEGSELVAEALGEHIFEWFLRNKRAEWADYKAQVTQFELDRYLPAW